LGILSYIAVTIWGNPLVPAVNPDSFLGLVMALWERPWGVGVVVNFLAMQLGSIYWKPKEESLDAYKRQHTADFDDTTAEEVFDPTAIDDGYGTSPEKSREKKAKKKQEQEKKKQEQEEKKKEQEKKDTENNDQDK
jgi:hypothetical protein